MLNTPPARHTRRVRIERLDPCLELVHQARDRERWTPLQKLVALPLRRMALHSDTPQERIEGALHRELSDLSARACHALGDAAIGPLPARAADAARDALTRAQAEGCFPRHELQQIARGPVSDGRTAHHQRLRGEIDRWIEKHERFERRLRWLLNPEVTRARLATLDPLEDRDQLWCFVQYEFRPEILYCAWGNGIERISQSESASTFFHATGAAESTPLKRSEDTLIHYYNLFNWGLDSFHGRKAVESMNQMHGRYFIHNDGMKYVLLNAAFSVLDALGVIGHRPLSDTERLGYFHAQIEMGRAMNIQELSHSWDEMRAWFATINTAFSAYTPQKRRMWTSIEDNFDRDAGVPWPVGRIRRLLEIAAMDDTYRSALGFEKPSAVKLALAKSVVKPFVKARALLPCAPYILSLQNFVTYPNGVHIEEAGEKQRSARMPSACPFSAKGRPDAVAHPENQRPLLHAGEAPGVELHTIGWDEVRRHRTQDDLWVVFGGHVYDVSAFAKNHPGGLQVLLNGAGKDMTRAFDKANHSDMTKVFTLNFRIGRIDPALPVAAGEAEHRLEA